MKRTNSSFRHAGVFTMFCGMVPLTPPIDIDILRRTLLAKSRECAILA